jgi:tRNA threonylcarbamoyladenosine modification (KEOPS) complex Cgi121 subunit
MNEALRLADKLDREYCNMSFQDIFAAAAELRSIVAQRDQLLKALKQIAATKNLAKKLEAEWCPAAAGMVRMAEDAIAKIEEEL